MGSVALLLICLSPSLRAQDTDQDEELPDRALLEFLGRFETQNGEWLDPMLLQNVAELKQDAMSEEDKKHD
ncbi:MAG: hypothetical protein BMS9Abin36_0950 [Gammaproteobacteria bacterium]|nr:MAG: hypothetical protein BMS9Abin36_0950 [Gammaproteobacteria bacterium]